MIEKETVIAQTKKWITDVVIGCNFCPFAAKEVKQNTLHYQVESGKRIEEGISAFLKECIRLDDNENIETTLLLFPQSFQKFDDYLNLVSHAENLLRKKKYEGIYQLASFHPLYCFSGASMDDAANFTNRSPYPMLHILREDSVEQALGKYPHPEKIPENNISFTREKGYEYMKKLREACLKN